MPAAAVVAVGAVAGAAIQSAAASSAARTQARAYERGIASQRAAAAEAKGEILDRMVPALTDYRAGIQDAQTEIANGTADVFDLLQQYTGNADQILASTGADAQRAIMGSSASAQGMPMSQFNQMYDTMQSAPPTARAQMQQQMQSVFRSGVKQATLGGTGATIAQQREATPIDGKVVAPGGLAQTGQVTAMGQPGQVTSSAVGAPVPVSQGITAQPTAAPSPVSTSGIGFTGAMQNLQQGYGTAQSALDRATAQARSDVTSGTSQALGMLEQTREAGLGRYQPYSEAGQAAVAREAALSGAYGPEAQQEAINAFIESPGQAYLRQQQEKALLRNQAAIGGLGGANVRTALQEQAMGIAATQQQQYLENLRSLATRGQEVAGAEAGIIGQTGMLGAQMTQGVGQTLAQLSQQYGISSADLARMTSSQMAELAQNTGLNLANIQQATGAARAGLQTELGSGLATAQAAGTTDIANLISQGATTGLNTQQNISQMLANLATGTGSNIANLQAAQGGSLAAGQYLQGQALAQGIQGLGQAAMYSGLGTTTPTTTVRPYSGGQSTVSYITDTSHLD